MLVQEIHSNDCRWFVSQPHRLKCEHIRHDELRILPKQRSDSHLGELVRMDNLRSAVEAYDHVLLFQAGRVPVNAGLPGASPIHTRLDRAGIEDRRNRLAIDPRRESDFSLFVEPKPDYGTRARSVESRSDGHEVEPLLVKIKTQAVSRKDVHAEDSVNISPELLPETIEGDDERSHGDGVSRRNGERS
jgi:hypothetical protein